MIKIKKNSFLKLIQDTIRSFDDEERTYEAFIDFLNTNGLLSEYYGCASGLQGTLGEEKNYENLTERIRSFLLRAMNEGINHQAEAAEYLFTYLHLVYYRAQGREYRLNPCEELPYGMTYDESFGYLNEHGTILNFWGFCIKKRRTIPYITKGSDDLFYKLMFYTKDGKRAIKEASDNDFQVIYSSYIKAGGPLDYRLFSYIAFKCITEIEQSEKFNRLEIEDIVRWKEDLLNISKRDHRVDFHEFRKEPCAIDIFKFATPLFEGESFPNLEPRAKTMREDLKYFGSLAPKILKTSRLVERELPKEPIEYFCEFIEKEMGRRREKWWESQRIKKSYIDPKQMKRLVINFLKSGKKAMKASKGNPYLNFNKAYQAGSVDYELLYQKLAMDDAAVQLLAQAQKEFEERVPYGLAHRDYSTFTFVPVKTIERMFKTALYIHYDQEMQNINANIINQRKSGNSKEKTFVTNKPSNSERYEFNPYELELGPITKHFKHILHQLKSKNPNVSIPWFLDAAYSDFKTHFINHIRNNEFHVNMVSGEPAGEENYYRVAFWFVEILHFLDPFN